VLAALVALLLSADAGARGQVVSVEIGPARSTRGSLVCALFRDGGGFPRRPDTAIATLRVPVRPDRGGTCRFDGVAPGTYAVAVLHDENDNGRMDFGWLGLPKEGYGVSNNRTHALSAPTWDESKFRVDAGRDVVLSVSLRY
jgi:uncharacterized protein (DUF2141 family)